MMAAVVRAPLLVLLAALALAVGGWWAWQRLPVDALPDVSDNQVIVWAEWPGASPADIEAQVTGRMARALQGLAGVRTVRGLSLAGSSYVYVIFEDGRNSYECRTRTLERLAQIQSLLPAGVQARLGPDATALGQVYAFVLRGAGDVEQRRHVLDHLVLPALAGVPGVAEVAPVGGVVREYQIDIDPVRFEEQALTLDMVTQAVREAGRDVGALSVEHHGVETQLRGVGFIRSIAEVENIVLRGNRERSAGLRLKDVATVQMGGAPREGVMADAQGEQVGAIVAMRVGADPAAVIAAVRQRLASLAPALARAGVTAEAYYDRSELIQETNATLVRTLIEELVVTVLVVLAFLWQLRACVAVGVVLPLGVLATVLVMHVAGVGANLMSLAGIAIAIGVMVDFAIVMTESIAQHLGTLHEQRRQAGLPLPTSPWDPDVVQAVIAGAQEVSRALLTAAATTIIGFVPLWALTDQAGRLFIPLAMTKTVAIAAAVVLGLFVVPVLCRGLLPSWYAPRWVRLTAAGAAALVAGAWYGCTGITVPQEYGRWAVVVPGWLAGPVVAALAAWVMWRWLGERLIAVEQNPVSRGIHHAYAWAFAHLQRHRLLFIAALLLVATTGWLVGVGWPTLTAPVRAAVAAWGGDMSATRIDRVMAQAFPGIGASFLPPLDEGALLFMPSLPAHAGLGVTLDVMAGQNERLAAIPEVASVMGKMGRATSALDPAPLSMIETVVTLKPYRAWPAQEMHHADGSTTVRPRTLEEVRHALAAAADIPGVAPSWLQPIQTRVVMLSTGIRSAMALQVLGDDSDALEAFALQAEPIIAGVPGAVDVQMQREGGKPYGEIRLDRQRMARFSITPEQVMAAVETALGGQTLAMSVEGGLRYGVRLRYARERRDDGDEMALLQVPIGAGQHGAIALESLVARPVVMTVDVHGVDAASWLAAQSLAVQRAATPLNATRFDIVVPAGEAPVWAAVAGATATTVASAPAPGAMTWTMGPMAIRSEGGRRTQYVLVNARGRPEVEVIRDAESRLRAAIADGRIHLPPGATWRWVGTYEQKMKADATLTWVITVSVLLMIVLIYLGTRSGVVTTVIVLANVSVTTAGGFIAVWWAGADMTTAVIVGFLVLLGVMFNDGILLGTYLHEQFRTLPADVDDVHRRVFAAGLRRRRPALMTNCTTLLALVPVLWSDGRGAELMRPMVLPVVGGMTADLLSLFSVPIVVTMWWEWRLARTARAAR